MSTEISIGIVGAGRLATQLSLALEDGGYQISVISNRSRANAELLQERLYRAEICPDLDFSAYNCRVVVVAVSDSAIESVTRELVVNPGTLVVHTSGTTSVNLINNEISKRGVFYPMQTFSITKKADFSKVPICIETLFEDDLQLLAKIGNAISTKVYQLSEEERQVLHLAAVFSSNFSNHLLSLAQEILAERGIDFDILENLMTETIAKSFKLGPIQAQTGPAVRRDFSVIQNHEWLLKENPELFRFYKLFTESIIKRH